MAGPSRNSGWKRDRPDWPVRLLQPPNMGVAWLPMHSRFLEFMEWNYWTAGAVA